MPKKATTKMHLHWSVMSHPISVKFFESSIGKIFAFLSSCISKHAEMTITGRVRIFIKPTLRTKTHKLTHHKSMWTRVKAKERCSCLCVFVEETLYNTRTLEYLTLENSPHAASGLVTPWYPSIRPCDVCARRTLHARLQRRRTMSSGLTERAQTACC